MNQSKYYTPMSEKSFQAIKQESIKIWSTYDDTYNYATEKINRIKDLENIQDNAMYIIAMFDMSNISKLLSQLDEETLEELKDDRLPKEYYQ